MSDDRTIRYPSGDRRKALLQHRRVIQEVSDRGAFGRDGGPVDQMLTYWDRGEDAQLMSGDPASRSGTKIAYEELDVTLQAMVSAGAQLKEMKLTFPTNVAPHVVFNIQTGVYAGGIAALVGDATIQLPLTGIDFAKDARVVVTLNGQVLVRGSLAGAGEVYWVSSTQLALNPPLSIFPGNEVVVKAP